MVRGAYRAGFVVVIAACIVGYAAVREARAADGVAELPMLMLELGSAQTQQAQEAIELELRRLKLLGQPTNIAEVIPPEVPDDENAAVVYQQAFDALQLSGDDEQMLVDLWRTGVSAQTLQGAEQVLRKNAEALSLLEEAAEMDKCRFPIDWEAGFGALFPHLARMRACARLLAGKVGLHVHREDVGEAIRAIRLGLALCRALDDDPILINELVRYAILAIMVEPTRACFERTTPSANECHELFGTLGELEFSDAFVEAMMTERALAVSEFERLREHPGKAGELAKMAGGDPAPGQMTYFKLFGRSILIHDEAAYLDMMSRLIPAIRKPYREIGSELRELRESFNELPDSTCPLTKLLFPVLDERLAGKRDEAIARCGLGQVTAAVVAYREKTRKYPASLDAVEEAIEWAELPRDPFSGDAFRYERQEDGFVVYSIGMNLRDDGGEAGERPEEGDIVWKVGR